VQSPSSRSNVRFMLSIQILPLSISTRSSSGTRDSPATDTARAWEGLERAIIGKPSIFYCILYLLLTWPYSLDKISPVCRLRRGSQ